jgi:hypothetical protein
MIIDHIAGSCIDRIQNLVFKQYKLIVKCTTQNPEGCNSNHVVEFIKRRRKHEGCYHQKLYGRQELQ